jgi:hypothetical protein
MNMNSNMMQQGGPPPQQQMGNFGQGGQGGMGGAPGQGGNVFNEEYRIPDRLVGLVIGRGGEQIKRLQFESGCKIKIVSESDGSIERACTLTGSRESIDEAKRMLDDVVRRGLSRENGSGGQMRGQGPPPQMGGGQMGGPGGAPGQQQGGGFQRY